MSKASISLNGFDKGMVLRVDNWSSEYEKIKVNYENIVTLPNGTLAPKYLRNRKYFFDGQVWGWR